MIDAGRLVCAIVVLLLPFSVSAEGPDAVREQIQGGQELQQVVEESVQAGAVTPAKNQKRKARGSVPREKEAEGTEAPNRFEADPVIKSQYRLNGQPLEVDPD